MLIRHGVELRKTFGGYIGVIEGHKVKFQRDYTMWHVNLIHASASGPIRITRGKTLGVAVANAQEHIRNGDVDRYLTDMGKEQPNA